MEVNDSPVTTTSPSPASLVVTPTVRLNAHPTPTALRPRTVTLPSPVSYVPHTPTAERKDAQEVHVSPKTVPPKPIPELPPPPSCASSIPLRARAPAPVPLHLYLSPSRLVSALRLPPRLLLLRPVRPPPPPPRLSLQLRDLLPRRHRPLRFNPPSRPPSQRRPHLHLRPVLPLPLPNLLPAALLRNAERNTTRSSNFSVPSRKMSLSSRAMFKLSSGTSGPRVLFRLSTES